MRQVFWTCRLSDWSASWGLWALQLPLLILGPVSVQQREPTPWENSSSGVDTALRPLCWGL